MASALLCTPPPKTPVICSPSDGSCFTPDMAISPITSNKCIGLLTKFTSSENSTAKDLYLRFFNADTNQTTNNVSFFINVTKQDKILEHDLFFTHSGILTIKFQTDMAGNRTSLREQDPVLGGWTSANDTFVIRPSIFTNVGLYHIHVEILAINYTIVNQTNTPKFDSWWSVDDKGNISKYDNAITFSVKLKDEPPLKQIDHGIPTENITCSNNLELIYKASDKYPACVQHTTVEKLVQRGWAIRGQPISYFVKTDGFIIPYDLVGGNMLGAKSYVQNKSVIFSVHTTSSGVLYVVIPRALLDSKSAYSNQDAKFIILVDKHEVKYTETTSIANRTLSIPFDIGAKEIEITATVGI